MRLVAAVRTGYGGEKKLQRMHRKTDLLEAAGGECNLRT